MRQEDTHTHTHTHTHTPTKRLLIGRGRWSKTVTAHFVKCNGLGDENIVGKIIKAIDGMGYRKVIIKTDGEPFCFAVQAP